MAEPLTAGAGDNAAEVKLACDVSGWERGLDKAAQAVAQSAAKTEAAFAQTGQAVAAASAKAGQSVDELVAETLRGLDQQRKSIGKTADQIRLMELAEKGATQTQLAEVQKRVAANDKARVAAQKAQQAQQGALQGLGSSLGGGVLSQFATGGLIAGLTAVAVAGVKMGIDVLTGIEKFNRAAERSTKLTAEMERGLDRTARRAGEMTAAIADPAARLAELEAQLAATEKNVIGKAGRRGALEKALEETTDWKAKVNPWEAITGGREAEEKATRTALDEIGAALAKDKEKAADLREAIAKLKDPMQDPAFKGALGQMSADLDRQLKTWGMTADQVKVYELRVKDTFGTAAAEIDKVEAKVKELAEETKKREAADAFYAQVKALDEQARAIGKVGDALELQKLKEKGLSDAQLGVLENQMKANAEWQKSVDLFKTYDEVMAGLDKEAASIGKTADEVKLMELAAAGMGEKRLAEIEARMKEVADLKAADEAAKKVAEPAGVAAAAVGASREAQKAVMGDDTRRGNPMVAAAKAAEDNRKKDAAEAKQQRAEQLRAIKDLLENARQFPPVVIQPF